MAVMRLFRDLFFFFFNIKKPQLSIRSIDDARRERNQCEICVKVGVVTVVLPRFVYTFALVLDSLECRYNSKYHIERSL